MPLDRRSLLLMAPLGIAAVGGAAFWAMLQRMGAGKFDPHSLPSALIGKKLPEFSLPGVAGKQGFSSADIAAARRPAVINFFASWCVPCVEEAPQMAALAERGVPIWGIAYKDKPDATAFFLKQNGDPYGRIAADAAGRVAIDFGVYGVPETYVVDRDGIVRWRWAGAMTEDAMRQELLPLLQRAT